MLVCVSVCARACVRACARVRVCSLHMSECVSKVPHSFITSSSVASRKNRQETGSPDVDFLWLP